MKVFCIGSNIESYESLKYLVENNCKIDALITLPSGNSQNVSDYYDLHDFCNRNNITTIDTTNVNSKETIQAIVKHKPDYLFTLGWSQIFKEEFISAFSGFVVGTHPSLLPYGRGRAPLPWTILEDLRVSAVSFFKIDTGIDTGKIIFQRRFKIQPDIYVGDLYEIVAKELGFGFLEIYNLINSKKTINFTPQNTSNLKIRGKRTPSDGFIDFKSNYKEIYRLVRAVSKPYPGAYTYYKDEKIVFWKSELDYASIHLGTYGQILAKNVKNKGLLVQFKDGTLWLNEPTLSDGSELNLAFFKIGDKLGYNLEDEIFKLKKHLTND